MQSVFYFVVAIFALALGYFLGGAARRKRPVIAGLFVAIALGVAGVFAWWGIAALD